MLMKGWSVLVHLFPILLSTLPKFWGSFRTNKWRLVSLSPTCSQTKYLSFFSFLWFSFCGLARWKSPKFCWFSCLVFFFSFFFLNLVCLPGLDDQVFFSQNHKKFYTSHSPGWILVGGYLTKLSLFTHWKIFFTSALAGGLSLKYEWQQVSASVQGFSHDSDRSQKCSSLDYLCLSSYFQLRQCIH